MCSQKTLCDRSLDHLITSARWSARIMDTCNSVHHHLFACTNNFFLCLGKCIGKNVREKLHQNVQKNMTNLALDYWQNSIQIMTHFLEELMYRLLAIGFFFTHSKYACFTRSLNKIDLTTGEILIYLNQTSVRRNVFQTLLFKRSITNY